jgi:hypothetical protein
LSFRRSKARSPDLQAVAEHPKCHFERSEKSYNVNNTVDFSLKDPRNDRKNTIVQQPVYRDKIDVKRFLAPLRNDSFVFFYLICETVELLQKNKIV